jgi:uncharacterized protein DUF3570
VAASSRRWTIPALAAAALALTATLDWSQNEVNVQFHAFDDSRGVTVLSPTVDLSKDFTERTAVRLKFGVDAITAASDSCVRCHQQGVGNSRQVFNGSLVRKYGDTKVSIGGEFGREKFYRATTFFTSVTRDLNNSNTTVAGGFSFATNQPLLHPSQQRETQLVPDGFVALTQTLSKTTVAQVGYEVSHISGYQTDPFLRAPVNGQMQLGATPDARTRQTLALRLRQALPASTILEADYRRYHDNWSIDSDTLTAGLSHHFNPLVLANFSYRWYGQTGVFFYQPQYVGNPQYFTADYRLIPFDSGVYTGKIELTPHGGFWRLRDGSALTIQYDRNRANTGFEAGILSAGLRVPF